MLYTVPTPHYHIQPCTPEIGFPIIRANTRRLWDRCMARRCESGPTVSSGWPRRRRVTRGRMVEGPRGVRRRTAPREPAGLCAPLANRYTKGHDLRSVADAG